MPELIQPLSQYAEPMWVDKVNPPCSLGPICDETGFFQHSQVLRYRRSANRQPPGYGTNRFWSRIQLLKNAAACWISKRSQGGIVGHD